MRAQEPAPPAGGFATVAQFDQTLVLDDGALTAFDVRRPDPALYPSPPGGRPLLVLCHGLGGSRTDFRAGFAVDFAARGYVVVAYDLRGHGLFADHAANVGKRSDFAGVRDRRDLKRVLDHAVQLPGVAVDAARTGVLGFSLGGGLAWTAAAWSGRVCDDADPGFGVFPSVRAVAALAWNPDFGAALAPRKSAQAQRLSQLLFANESRLDASLMNALAAATDAEDPIALAAIAGPDRDLAVGLASTTTAVFHGHSFRDRLFSPAGAAAALAAHPPGTPRRLFLSAIGDHGSAPNFEEGAVGKARLFAWFDARLRGLPVALDEGPACEWSAEPAAGAQAADPTAVYSRRYADAWPPPTTADRWHLSGASASRVPATSATAPPRSLGQTAGAAPLTTAAWRAAGFDASLLSTALTSGEIAFVGAPLTAALECAGALTGTLDLAPHSSAWQLCLAFGVAEPGGFRCLATALIAERGPGAAIPGPRSFTGAPFAAILPAGAVPEFRLRTQAWREDPGGPAELLVVPEWHSVSCDVRDGPLTPSFVDLPALLAPRVGAALFVDPPAISLASPTDAIFTLRTGADGVFSEALTGLSLAGTNPGMPLGPLWLPLNVDELTVYMFTGYDTWPFDDFVGTADAGGRRVAAFRLAPAWIPPSFAGVVFYGASVLLGPQGVYAVSNPTALQLTL